MTFQNLNFDKPKSYLLVIVSSSLLLMNYIIGRIVFLIIIIYFSFLYFVQNKKKVFNQYNLLKETVFKFVLLFFIILIFLVIINPNDSTYNATLNSANEIKARGAKIIGISDKESDVYDYWIEIPPIDEPLYPIIEIIPIQLLAYYSALEKKTNPDYPRNLAKSVTVK